jgi:hypothetical protein
MADPKDWKEAYEAVQLALDPAKQLQFCQEAHRLIQRRMVDLAQGPGEKDEQEALEEALTKKPLGSGAGDPQAEDPVAAQAARQSSAKAPSRNSKPDNPFRPLMDPLSRARSIRRIGAEPLENFLCQLFLACR